MRNFLRKFTDADTVRFCAVGICATTIDFAFYMLFSICLHILLAKGISMLISSVFSYLLNKNWTFRNTEKTNGRHLFRYSLTFAANIGTNTLINYLVFKLTQMKLAAFIISTCCAMVVNFLLQKYFVFNKKSDIYKINSKSNG